MWTSGKAKEVWEEKIYKARLFLLEDLAKLVVDAGLTKFAPTNNIRISTIKLAKAFVANHYMSRWSNVSSIVNNMQYGVMDCGVYGDYDGKIREERWDVLRDLWQEALAPDCCKESYFNSTMKDPYMELNLGNGTFKKLDASLNSFLTPIGLFLSPIVACHKNCEHAKQKAKQIEELVKNHDNEIYETLKMVTEMSLSIDSYRGMVIIDTPMFKAVYSSDALKEKKILKIKPTNTSLFNYSHDWVANGSVFPYKGVFSETFITK